MGERARHHFRLFVDFLGHEMAVVALVDQKGRRLRLDLGANDNLIVFATKHRRAATQNHPVVVFEIGDGVGEGGQSEGVGAEVHFAALAIADRQRRAAPRADQQVFLALEQEGQREGAFQTRQAGGDRLLRRKPMVERFGDEMGHRFGVGLGDELMPLDYQFVP